MTGKKAAPPALNLPPLDPPARPASKVEQGLAAAEPAPSAEPTADELRERAIEAMVAAGLPREYAEASFELSAGFDAASAVDAAHEVAELAGLASQAPLCAHGCHGESWAAVRADLDAVSCEHGGFPRRPQG